MAKSRVEGHRETARAMRKLTLSQRPVTEASRHALQPILKTAKSNLRSNGNVLTGELVRSMAIRKQKAKRGLSQMVVAATGKGVKKAHLVEFGTDPHWQPRRGVMHPGARPFPFLTPAFAQHDDEAIKRFGKEIGPALERQARRVAAKRR